MQDAWRAYLELALGVTEASRKKAREVARDLLGKGEATAAQVQSFVDDLVATSRTNREGLARLVRYEVDRALGAVGLASAEDVVNLTARLRELERRLNESGTAAAAPARGGSPAIARSSPAQPATAKKAASKPAKTAARKAANPTVAKKTVAKKTVAKKTATRAAKKTTATKSAG